MSDGTATPAPDPAAPHCRVPVQRLGPEGTSAPGGDDTVVVEEPLEVRHGSRSLLITMRTPGHDLDLVRGLLFTEGLIRRAEDLTAVAYCRDPDVPLAARGNVVTVALAPGAALDEERTLRAGLVSSGCGICGKATLESIAVVAPPVGDGPTVSPSLLAELPNRLRRGQSVFDQTGGLHAAALFAEDGKLLSLREDVGRHNAVDKVIGEAMRFGRLPLRSALLVVSGRAGFEIVHKARMAGIPIVGSVSAPSSLAIALARDGNQTLVAFLRDGRGNVYCGAGRITDHRS